MAKTSTQWVPGSREDILSQVGPAKVQIYRTVREILDRMDEAAPWEMLYYPPADARTFVGMEASFLEVVEEIPKLIKVLTDGLERQDDGEQILGDAQFFFQGIHENVAFDINKLRSKIKALSVTGFTIELTPDERAFTCEISADLKGKYASSIMGAAAAIIAEGRWNGVEIEPILFPEKEEEFDRNELLVETLYEVVHDIGNLLEDLPLAELAESWRGGERVDQYALTSLYSFLGNLGKLMKGKCRRALYSGDYHQIQKRENLLSSRINELTTLHNVTWGTVPPQAVPGGDEPFPAMILRATELAAILDINILRKIIGDRYVKDLLSIVTIERERRNSETLETLEARDEPKKKSTLRKNLPEELHSLIPLMYDEDLQNFLSLLLGSVQKRASLSVTRNRTAEREAAERSAAQAPEAKSDVVAQPTAEESPVAKIDLAAELALGEESGTQTERPQRLDSPETFELSASDLELVEPAEVEFDAANPFESVPEVEFDDPTGLLARPSTAEENDVLSMPDDAFDPIDWGSGTESAADIGADFATRSEPEIEDTIAAFEEAVEMAEVGVVESGPPLGEKLRLLRDLHGILEPLQARSNGHRKSFEMVHRLLKQKRMVPPAMLESMHPYLYDVMNMLIPQLHQLSDVPEISPDHGSNLIEFCTFLCRNDLGPQQLKGEVPTAMERLLRLLDGLESTTQSLIRELDPLA